MPVTTVEGVHEGGFTGENADGHSAGEGFSVGGEVGANIQKIFSYGHRNGFGMAFDPYSGLLWETENGDDSFSELNRIEIIYISRIPIECSASATLFLSVHVDSRPARRNFCV